MNTGSDTPTTAALQATPVAEMEPYIPAGAKIPEFTIRAVAVGTVLGMVFGASSLYLVLKTGLTVSASIPVAVISIALFRMLSKFGFRRGGVRPFTSGKK